MKHVYINTFFSEWKQLLKSFLCEGEHFKKNSFAKKELFAKGKSFRGRVLQKGRVLHGERAVQYS